ncbi:hypothetical protein CDAR_480771 [Caerostris darwini]|uniref:Uncharacterized protein n=1 Tax=Caerostris darwini TaxID=1538125 RepID=A0AAV4S110_9ARAC|nr:hypothetical protein CDAR_480771 [Caerostris darwini]
MTLPRKDLMKLTNSKTAVRFCRAIVHHPWETTSIKRPGLHPAKESHFLEVPNEIFGDNLKTDKECNISPNGQKNSAIYMIWFINF